MKRMTQRSHEVETNISQPLLPRDMERLIALSNNSDRKTTVLVGGIHGAPSTRKIMAPGSEEVNGTGIRARHLR